MVLTQHVCFFLREQVINLVILSRHLRLWVYVIPKSFKVFKNYIYVIYNINTS
jgi:hypothetical protein